MTPETHQTIDHALCGAPAAMSPGAATVTLATTAAMTVDASGLVHGGFVFGAVDHAAMLAVNHPNVVLGAADVRFTAPVRQGAVVTCAAEVVETKGRKRVVAVDARVGDTTVLQGRLTAFVLDRHVLDASG